MGTGLLRRHRDALVRLREEEAAHEITELATVVPEPEPTPVDNEPDSDAPIAEDRPSRTKRTSKKTQE